MATQELLNIKHGYPCFKDATRQLTSLSITTAAGGSVYAMNGAQITLRFSAMLAESHPLNLL